MNAPFSKKNLVIINALLGQFHSNFRARQGDIKAFSTKERDNAWISPA